MRRLIPPLAMLLICAAVLVAGDETLLLRQPTINGKEIVFVYGGDLWTVPTSGGEARRLTSLDRRVTRNIYVAVLRKELPSPFGTGE